MSFLNPLAGTVAGQQLAQTSLEADKVRQARRAQAVSKNIAAASDRLEHEVESTDAVKPVDPNDRQSDPRQRQRPPKDLRADDDRDELPHIDLKA